MPHRDREERLAYLRRWKERNRPSPEPEQQTDPDLPPRGVMRFSADGTKVQCHVCGKWLGTLNAHLRTHELDKHSYKELYDLPRTISMLPASTKEKQRQAALDRDQGAIGRQHIPPAVGRIAGQKPRLGVRIRASQERKGISTRGDTDWETDTRPYDDLLKAWRGRHGWSWQQVADELREPLDAVKMHAKGHFPADTQARRRLMTLIDKAAVSPTKAWWEDRAEDLADLTLADFAAGHGVAVEAVAQARTTLFGSASRQAGWWRTPEIAVSLMADRPDAAIAQDLGVSAGSVRRLRWALQNGIGRPAAAQSIRRVGRFLSEDELATAARMIRDGASAGAVGVALGVSAAGIIWRAKKGSLPPLSGTPGRNKVSAERKEKAIEMHRQGATNADIQRACHISRPTLDKLLKGAGLQRPKSGNAKSRDRDG